MNEPAEKIYAAIGRMSRILDKYKFSFLALLDISESVHLDFSISNSYNKK